MSSNTESNSQQTSGDKRRKVDFDFTNEHDDTQSQTKTIELVEYPSRLGNEGRVRMVTVEKDSKDFVSAWLFKKLGEFERGTIFENCFGLEPPEDGDEDEDEETPDIDDVYEWFQEQEGKPYSPIDSCDYLVSISK